MEEALTRAVIKYQNDGQGWEALFERISLLVYQYPRRKTEWDEDRCSEFYLNFLHKIPKLVQNFRPDFSFESYLYTTLKWCMKTFRYKQAVQEQYECWSEETAELNYKQQLYEADWPESPDSGQQQPFQLNADGALENLATRRRLLCAVLLRAADIDDFKVPEIAALTGVDPEWLYGQTRRARQLVTDKTEKREQLRQRRNECWYQLNGASRRAEEVFDSGQKNELYKQAAVWRKRHSKVSSVIKKMNVTLSHREIGQLLGIPAGTVSSGLHLLRRESTKNESSG